MHFSTNNNNHNNNKSFSRWPPHPVTAVPAEPRGIEVSAVVELDVVVAAVRLLLRLEEEELYLHPVALLRPHHPVAVDAGRVVVAELCVGVQVSGLDLGSEGPAALWGRETTE